MKLDDLEILTAEKVVLMLESPLAESAANCAAKLRETVAAPTLGVRRPKSRSRRPPSKPGSLA